MKIFGDNLEILKSFADKVAEKLSKINGTEEVRTEQITGMDQYDVEYKREVMARYGINVKEANSALETAVFGKSVTTFLEADRRILVTVRFPKEYRAEIKNLEKLLIPVKDKGYVPFAEIASIKLIDAPAQISRENGKRRVVVETNIFYRATGSYIKELKDSLTDIIKELPTGYFINIGGQFENQERAMLQLSLVVPVSILIILILLYMALGSVTNSPLVLLILPFVEKK